VTPSSHRLSDFRSQDDSGVLLAPGMVPDFAYLDGAEGYLYEAFGRARDLSTGSPELAALERDWPTRYHLTPMRTTLFDAFGLQGSSARVLELGAGLGAITRWLGEHCREVHAVEGSIARARAARARTADLANVTVYAGNYSELDEQESFDVVTLIGVLEYSHMYHPTLRDPEAAALANLRVARRALRPDGVLVLAIENRLGLKYFAGAREDHCGRPYESIHGHPDHGVPVTWSRRDLERLVREAGFDASELYLPYPDYKLPTTIVNSKRATDADHVHNWIRTPAPDRSAARRHLPFSETLAQREAVRAGLAGDLANSHLVLAFAGDRERTVQRLGFDTDWVARHWSLSRRPCFTKRVTLRRDDAGATIVNDRPSWIGPEADAIAAELAKATGVTQHIRDERHEPGDLLVFDVLADVSRYGLNEQFLQHVIRFDAWLDRTYGVPGRPGYVRGEAFDVVWWNVVVDPADGAWRVIDREWEIEAPLPRDFLLWRMLVTFFGRHRLELPASMAGAKPDHFAQAILAELGKDGSAFLALEEQLQSVFAGNGVPERPVGLVGPAEPEGDAPFVLCMAADADPQAFRTWAAAVRPGEASLLLYGPGRDEGDLIAALQASIDAAAVNLDEHDLVVVPLDADAAVRGQAVAVLAHAPLAAPFADLPHFAPGDVAPLRRLLTGAPVSDLDL
jgi:SAM-dependent methyltransferase